MFLEMMLALFAIVIAGTISMSAADYAKTVAVGPAGAFSQGMGKFLGAVGLPVQYGAAYGSVMMILLAVTIMQLVVRFMRVTTAELLGNTSPVFKNIHVGTIIASILGITLVMTGWWQYLWVLFGGANQLMASLALLLVSAWLVSEGRSAAFALYPMIFMFITTIAALLYTSYNLLVLKVLAGAVKGEALIGNTLMGIVALFLVVAAVILAVEGIKAFRRFRAIRAEAAPSRA
jgi:carbon starvation protein